MAKLKIIRPHESFVTSYLDFIAEMRNLGEKIWESHIPRESEGHANFVARLLRTETSPEPGMVAETSHWVVRDQQVVGRIALRHALNKSLEEFGGHIGYEVRPSVRRMGVASEMLRLFLQTPKAREIARILLICAPDNIASNKTIMNNGAV